VGALTTPFDLASYTGAKLRLDVLKFDHEHITMDQRRARVDLQLGKQLRLSTSKPVRLLIKDVAVVLHPSQVRYDDGELCIKKSAFGVENFLTTGLAGCLNFASVSGSLALNRLRVRSEKGVVLFHAAQSLGLDLSPFKVVFR
jgi:hypothetical protein